MNATATRHYPALDGLRGLAALSVVIYHLGLTNGRLLAENAYLAVEFFFCLSGFVLARAYAGRLDRSLNLAGFVVVRLIRLMPMIMIADAIAAAIYFKYYPGGHKAWALAAGLGALNLPLLTAPDFQGGRFIFPLNPPQYSLFFELVANAVWAALHHRKVLLAIMCGASFILVATLGGGGGDQVPGFWSGFPRVAALFLLGVFLSDIEQRLTFNLSNRAWEAILAGTLGFSAWFFFAIRETDWMWYPWSLLIVPVLVVAGARVHLPHALARIARVAGDLSYPVYALQGPLIWISGYALGYFAITDPLLRMALSLGATLSVSAAALVYIDSPVRAMLTDRLRRIKSRKERGGQG